MSHQANPLRRAALTIGAVCAVLGLATQAQAADAAQRVALATPMYQAAVVSHAAADRASAKQAAATQRRASQELAAAKAAKPVNGRADNDGSRFQYDSCGCSGS